MNGYLYNRKTGYAMSIDDYDREPPDPDYAYGYEIVSVFIDLENEKIQVNGWMTQSSNQRRRWMRFPHCDAAAIALDLSRAIKLSDAENRLIDREFEIYGIRKI